MVQSLQANNPSRLFFSLPDLLDSQRDSFNEFLKEGIAKEFSKLSPIRVESKNIIAELFLDGENYQIVSPTESPRECILKMKTYDCKVYIKGQIIYKTFDETILYKTKSEWILVGHLPLMTKRGHFIINGSPRVIVQQVVRCPGIYFQQTPDKDPNKKSRFYADIIPKRGVWLRVQLTKKGEIQVKFKKGKKIQAEILQKCLHVIERQEKLRSLLSTYENLSQRLSSPLSWASPSVLDSEQMQKTFYTSNKSQELQNMQSFSHQQSMAEEKFFLPTPEASKQSSFNTNYATVLAKNLITLSVKKQSYLNEIYINRKRKQAELRKEEFTFSYTYDKLYRPTEDKEREQRVTTATSEKLGLSGAIKNENDLSDSLFKAQKCYTNLFSTFKIKARYDLSELGRQKINTKFGSNLVETELTALDLQNTRYWLHKYSKGEKRVDDIDHSRNRRIRTSGSLLQSQFEIGVERLKKFTWNKLKEFITVQVTEAESFDLSKASSLLFSSPFGVADASSSFHLQNEYKRSFSGDIFFKNTITREKVKVIKGLPFSHVETKANFIFNKNKANKDDVTSLLKAMSPYESHRSFLHVTLSIKNLTSLKGSLNNQSFLPYTKEQGSFPNVLLRRTAANEFILPRDNSVNGKKAFLKEKPVFKKEVSTLFPSSYVFPALAPMSVSSGYLLRSKDIKSKSDYSVRQKFTNCSSNFYRKIQFSLKRKESINLKNIVSAKPLTGAFREFFGSNPLSQYMDQTNPLAELTHKRRISSLGIGGVSRDSAGMAIRGIHATHYGRICPIETPEGKNAGLVNSLSFFAKVDSNGFIKTPYYKIFKGQVQHELGFSFFSAEQETAHNFCIAPNDLQKSSNNILQNNSVAVRVADNLLDLFKKIHPYAVDCIGISPIQMISVATALIPFLEHNDANRALMGSNMQRQAVPLMLPERPLVGTGLESIVLVESGHITQSKATGFISYVSCNEIIVESLKRLRIRSNKNLVTSKFLDFTLFLKQKETKQIKAIRKEVKIKTHSNRKFIDYSFSPKNQISKTSHTFQTQKKSTNVLPKFSFDQSRTLILDTLVSYRRFISKKKQHVKLKNNQTSLLGFSIDVSFASWSVTQKAGFAHVSKVVDNKAEQSHVSCFTKNKKRGFPAVFVKKQKNCKVTSELNVSTHVIQNFNRSNQDICLVERALVQEGEWVQRGDILTDCSASEKGELAVGKNILLAYLPWEGYNFEDAIVISDRLVKENIYTSLHIERYEFDAQDFREGNEWFTNDLPGIASKNVKHLNEFGLPKIGSFVKEGDILVGKIKYSNKKATTPYERLLCDILGEKNFAARDASLYLPRGVEARVIHSQLLGFDTFSTVDKGSSVSLNDGRKSFAWPPNDSLENEGPTSFFMITEDVFRNLKTATFAPQNSTNPLVAFCIAKRGNLVKQKTQAVFSSSDYSAQNGNLQANKMFATSNSMFRATPHYVKELLHHSGEGDTKNSLLDLKSLKNLKKLKNKGGETFLPSISNFNSGNSWRLPSKATIPYENPDKRSLSSFYKQKDELASFHLAKLSDPNQKNTLNSTNFALHLNSSTDDSKELGLKLASKKILPKVVNIFLGEKRPIQVGDKMSGRHGNKGVVSTILPRQDMPYLADGTPIDIILNPLGVPSRMNVGQVFECLLGLAATYLAQHFKITPFDETYGIEASQSLVYLKLYQARLKSGQNWLFQVDFPGKTRLIDGRSGEAFDQWVTVGRAYMLKLIHMVNEKIHARSTGPYALITQQPLRGRSQKGGQRLGEMEVWALQGFGAAYTLQELLTKKSDDSIGRKEIAASILPRPVSILEAVLLSDNLADIKKVNNSQSNKPFKNLQPQAQKANRADALFKKSSPSDTNLSFTGISANQGNNEAEGKNTDAFSDFSTESSSFSSVLDHLALLSEKSKTTQNEEKLGFSEAKLNKNFASLTETQIMTSLSSDIVYSSFRMEKDIQSKEKQKNYTNQSKLSLGQPEIFKVLVCELQALCLDIGLYTLTKQSFQKTLMTK